MEKIAENRTYAQFTPYVDRMDYCAAVTNGMGYVEAGEKLNLDGMLALWHPSPEN